MDRFIGRDEIVFSISSHHICPVLLGSGSARFCWDTDMQVGFFSPPSPNRRVELSRAKRQTDGSVRCTKKENVLYRPELCSGEGCVFSIAFKQNDPPSPFLAKQSVVCVRCLEMDFLKLSIPKAMEEKVFQIYDAANNGNTEIYLLKTDPFWILLIEAKWEVPKLDLSILTPSSACPGVLVLRPVQGSRPATFWSEVGFPGPPLPRRSKGSQ